MIAHTPSDTVDVNSEYSHGVFIESSGDVAVMYKDGTTHVFGSLARHQYADGHIKRVLATGTTVSSSDVYIYKRGIGASS